jgi:hypothetical protein
MSLRSYTVSVLDSQHKGAKWSTHRERERENRKSTSIYTEYTHTRRPGTSKQDLTANGSIPYIANSLMVHRYVFGGEEAHRIPSLHACDAIHAADTETCIASPRLAATPRASHMLPPSQLLLVPAYYRRGEIPAALPCVLRPGPQCRPQKSC